MNGGRRTGWLRIGAAFWGLGAGLLLAGVAAASEAAHGGGHGGISPEKIQDLIWRTVNFVVFAGILIKLVAKPAKNFFAQRSQDVATTLEDAGSQTGGGRGRGEGGGSPPGRSRQRAGRVIQQYMAEGEMEKAKILDKANLVAERIKEMAV